jgi:hypothetical protein
MGMGGQRHAPAALHPGQTRYPLYRRLGGPQGRAGQVRKISPTPGFDSRTLQSVGSRYTYWAIPVPCEVNTDPNLVPKLRVSGGISLLFLYVFMRCTGVALPLVYNMKPPAVLGHSTEGQFRQNQQDAALHNGIYYYECSTCFRRFLRPSSGAQNCINSIEYLSSFFCFLPLSWMSSNSLTKAERSR